MRPLPDLPGVRHSDHELPTGVRLHVAEAGDPRAPALLAVHGVERAGYVGHDWGGWTGWLLAIRAPERFSRLMLVRIVPPWTSRATALRNGWRLLYQWPL